MRPSRPSTTSERVGLAGAGLAIAAALFAVGGGLVSFGLWPDDLSHDGTQRIVLRTPAVERPVVQRPRRAAASPRAAGSQPRRAPSAVAPPALVAPAGAITIAEPPPVHRIPPVPVPVPTEPDPQPALPLPTDPLLPVGDIVDQTTTTLARTLGAFATALEQGLAGIGDLLGGPGP